MFWSRSQTQVFWAWFKSNRNKAERIVDEARRQGSADGLDMTHVDAVVAALDAAVHKVDPRLSLEFGPHGNNGYELVVTAEGDAAAFPAVSELVAGAPAIARWRFTALKQRQPADTAVAAGGLDVTSNDLRFVAAECDEHKDKFEFVFNAGAIDVATYEQALQALAAQSLTTLLGEHDAACYVANCIVLSGDDFVELCGHEGYPLADIPEMFQPVLGH